MERKVESEEAKVSAQTGLSEVLLEKVQQRDLIMFSRLRTSDAVSLIGINLEKKHKTQKNIIHCLLISHLNVKYKFLKFYLFK